MEGKYYLSVVSVLNFVDAFKVYCLEHVETHKQKKLHTMYTDLMHYVTRDLNSTKEKIDYRDNFQ